MVHGHQAPIYSLVFDRTGHRLVTGSDDGLVKVWSSTTGHLLHTLRGHDGEITDLTVDESNTLLASAATDETVRLWDVSTWRPAGVLLAHGAPITAVSFCPLPEERLLLVTTSAGVARLWPLDSTTPEAEVLNVGQGIWSAAWSPGGQRLALGCSDGLVRICSLKPFRVFQTLRVHKATSPVDSIKWANAGAQILTGCQDGTCRIWDWSSTSHHPSPLLSPCRRRFICLALCCHSAPFSPAPWSPSTIVPSWHAAK